MTAVKVDSSETQANGILNEVLKRADGAWIEETRSYLLPATVLDAPFWDRWTAVRYLADQFHGHYRRERALVEEFRSFLPAEAMARLSYQGERIGQLRLELDRIGRQRGRELQVATVSRELLWLLETWCPEIEAMAGRISRDLLSEEGVRLLDQL